jgi:hypothetical protein
LTDEILFGQLEHGGTVTIRLKDSALDFTYVPRTEPPAPSEHVG